MKLAQLLTIGALCLPASTLLADPLELSQNTPTPSNEPAPYTHTASGDYRHTDYDEHTPLFRDTEISLDLFGTYSAPQNTIEHLSGDRLQHTGRAGAGLGVNFFFLRYIGLGVDAYTENTAGSFVDNLSGNLILRLPIETLHIAPYVYGGGGRQFDPGQTYFGQVGAGLEVRIISHVGLFVDGRYVMTTDGSQNFAVARGGIRISF